VPVVKKLAEAVGAPPEPTTWLGTMKLALDIAPCASDAHAQSSTAAARIIMRIEAPG
jgi:hypothetical protein